MMTKVVVEGNRRVKIVVLKKEKNVRERKIKNKKMTPWRPLNELKSKPLFILYIFNNNNNNNNNGIYNTYIYIIYIYIYTHTSCVKCYIKRPI